MRPHRLVRVTAKETLMAEPRFFGVTDANGVTWRSATEWVEPGWHHFTFTTDTPVQVRFDGDVMHVRRLTRRERLIRWFRR
jgi:hypothetical protein